MGNGIAYLMLAIWPIICLVLFRLLTVERALIWSILGGYLFLPPLTEVNLPLVPALDKVSIPNVTVLVIMLFGLRQKVRLWPESRIAQVLVVGLVLSAIPTVMTNGDPISFQVLRDAYPIIFEVGQLPGQSIRDVGSVLIAQAVSIVPFLLARHFLASDEGLREILLALMVGALIYSIPALIEVRLSPQMNVWIYGYFQHSFAQMIRGDGFRPIVFLPHALWLALFVATALMATVALLRQSNHQTRHYYVLAACYLAVLLVLCKSLASLTYGLVLTPLVLMIPLRWQVQVAAIFALVAITYPMLRSFHLVPIDWILLQAEAISADRAQSLGYRFNNEEQLLARAAEKPLFGWGGWGRSLVRDPASGTILTIPDGRWIIIFGTFGWLGYLCEFGLLALPLILMGIYVWRNKEAQISPWAAPLCMILGITMMDMLLNDTLTPVTWLTAGAILGYAERSMPRPQKAPKYALSPTPLGAEAKAKGKRTVL